jgi:phosphopentomutase
MAKVLDAAASCAGGLIFANFVDFDMLYGHRNDAEGYAKAWRRSTGGFRRCWTGSRRTTC